MTRESKREILQQERDFTYQHQRSCCDTSNKDLKRDLCPGQGLASFRPWW